MARLTNHRSARVVLWGKLAWHPAVIAWSEVADDPVASECIEVLHQGKTSATYRLLGAGRDGGPIIARRVSMAKALILRTIYRQILPLLPITASRYCGFKAESPQMAWVFLADGSGADG